MDTTVLGYPRIGPRRELKQSTEAYWGGWISRAELQRTAGELRRRTWEDLTHAGLTQIPSNIFSLYDHVLDTAVLKVRGGSQPVGAPLQIWPCSIRSRRSRTRPLLTRSPSCSCSLVAHSRRSLIVSAVCSE
jgi:hypothetical protein